MSGIAELLITLGYDVSGSDLSDSATTRQLQSLGGRVYQGHDGRWVQGADVVVTSSAIVDDNPEVVTALEAGIPVIPRAEMLAELMRLKKYGIAIAGSHGKTTITAMVMHVLQHEGLDFDFMVGAQLDGFDVMVKISKDANIMLFEGDEYLTSALDPRPKFHLYKPHLALITGIAWDHINVFPTFEIYIDQFRKFIQLIEAGGKLIYYSRDELLEELLRENISLSSTPYNLPEYTCRHNTNYLSVNGIEYPIHIFGNHNLQNIQGAMLVCEELGVARDDFARAISSFEGASRRLQLIDESEDTSVYLDFAHAPSKLRATVDAVKGHYDSSLMLKDILNQSWKDANLLLMSSGNFDGLDPSAIASLILNKNQA